ncbi:uncharacterized protein LTHEOB_6381 [Lasiodiplodia theobromae]|uniref:uncharacterized protein n=1 Tax=Lasiodiplodia theobromae TaxID=45133 RepID=UPI0015C3D1D7|nr:uncharacterized protein LTHEOB_6381 [Lasiodiplodia theobromae]KAF4544263.1 hypothetical protein LTHEOB_6381 [Lasiodiplodia theobromae]
MAPRSSSTSPTKKSAAGGHKKNSSTSSNSSKIALPRKSIPAPLTRLKFIPQRTSTAARQQRPASLAQAGPSRATSIRMSPSPTKLIPAAGAAATAVSSPNPSAAGPLSPGGAAGLRQLRILNASTVDLPGTAGSPDATAAPTPATTSPAERSPPPSRLPLAIVPPSRKPVPPVRNPARPPPVINQISPMGTTTTFIFPAPPTGPVPPVRPPLPPPSLSTTSKLPRVRGVSPPSPATTSSKLPRVRRGISPPSPPPGFAPPHLPPAAYIPAGARRGVSAPIRFLAGSDAGSLLAPPAVNGRGRGRGGMPAPGRGSGHGRGMPPRLPIPNFSRPLWRVRGGAWPRRSSSMPVAPAGPVGVAFSQSLPGRLSALPEAGLVPFQQLGEEKKEEGEEGAAWPLADKPLPPLPKKDN